MISSVILSVANVNSWVTWLGFSTILFSSLLSLDKTTPKVTPKTIAITEEDIIIIPTLEVMKEINLLGIF